MQKTSVCEMEELSNRGGGESGGNERQNNKEPKERLEDLHVGIHSIYGCLSLCKSYGKFTLYSRELLVIRWKVPHWIWKGWSEAERPRHNWDLMGQIHKSPLFHQHLSICCAN